MLVVVARPSTTLLDPKSTGSQVRQRRVRLGQKQRDTVRLAGHDLSPAVLSLLENGGQATFADTSLEAIRRALRWPDDWVHRVDELGENLVDYLEPGPGAPPLFDQWTSLRPGSYFTVEILEAIRERQPATLDELLDIVDELSTPRDAIAQVRNELMTLKQSVAELSARVEALSAGRLTNEQFTVAGTEGTQDSDSPPDAVRPDDPAEDGPHID